MENETRFIKTVCIEVFQDDSPDATQALAEAKASISYPGHKVLGSRFLYAHPGNSDGRWVGIDVDLELDPSKTLPL
jgi:hypothetical protein